MPAKRYNGHRSWNAWNVALWISNDEGLYSLAKRALTTGDASRAARYFIASVGEGAKTPDGATYNFKCVREAMVGLKG